MYKAKDRHVIF